MQNCFCFFFFKKIQDAVCNFMCFSIIFIQWRKFDIDGFNPAIKKTYFCKSFFIERLGSHEFSLSDYCSTLRSRSVLESMIWFVRVMWFIWENLLCEGIWEVGKIILTVHQTEPKRFNWATHCYYWISRLYLRCTDKVSQIGKAQFEIFEKI